MKYFFLLFIFALISCSEAKKQSDPVLVENNPITIELSSSEVNTIAEEDGCFEESFDNITYPISLTGSEDFIEAVYKSGSFDSCYVHYQDTCLIFHPRLNLILDSSWEQTLFSDLKKSDVLYKKEKMENIYSDISYDFYTFSWGVNTVAFHHVIHLDKLFLTGFEVSRSNGIVDLDEVVSQLLETYEEATNRSYIMIRTDSQMSYIYIKQNDGTPCRMSYFIHN